MHVSFFFHFHPMFSSEKQISQRARCCGFIFLLLFPIHWKLCMAMFFMFMQSKSAVKGFPARRVSRYDHCLLTCFCYSFFLHSSIHRYSCSFGKVSTVQIIDFPARRVTWVISLAFIFRTLYKLCFKFASFSCHAKSS